MMKLFPVQAPTCSRSGVLMIRFYTRAAQVALTGKRTEDFNQYLSVLEKQFPARRETGMLRHRYAVSTGDKKSAEQIADRLLYERT